MRPLREHGGACRSEPPVHQQQHSPSTREKNSLKLPMKLASSFALTVCVLLICGEVAHAYMDPGTGSYLFQLLMASILGALFAIKMYWKSLKVVFKNLFSKNREADKPTDG